MLRWLTRIFGTRAGGHERGTGPIEHDEPPMDRQRALALIHDPSANPPKKIDAIKFLRDHRGPEIAEALRVALGRPNVIGWELDHVRVAALENLGHIAPEYVELFLESDSGDVRFAAAEALRRVRPASAPPPKVTVLVFRTADPPDDPKGYAEAILGRKMGQASIREWRFIGVKALPSEDQAISLYHQLTREGRLDDFGPAHDAWRDRGPDGLDFVGLVFK